MKTVLVAGSAVIDFIFHLDEPPSWTEKHRAREAAIVGGGCAANAAVAIARLGGKAVLSARLGDDMIGDMILSGLDEEGVDHSLVKRFAGRRSSYASVLVDQTGERCIIGYRDNGIDAGDPWVEQLELPPFEAALADTRWPEGACVMMRTARQRGVPGVMDGEAPLGDSDAALKLASHVAFSQPGLSHYAGSDDLEDGLKRAAGETGAFVCVTVGEGGVHWLEDGALRHMPAFAVDVVDTLGAGDVWHGAFTLKLAEGAGEEEAMRYAGAAAALKCTRFGGRSGTPGAEEVNSFLMENSLCN
ncbi:PfkB family carbohydrate kinase [Nitratireductor sp. XY-223]|uniref:PfkB family carbohydrate kinase n=1 Tax=Nitratireductor sp. XY-223 TaxID=2561926 RepID=UPI0010AA995C|nr:PfkB family carbohydrate kinase [Nitratireductor sp. XY-223]